MTTRGRFNPVRKAGNLSLRNRADEIGISAMANQNRSGTSIDPIQAFAALKVAAAFIFRPRPVYPPPQAYPIQHVSGVKVQESIQLRIPVGVERTLEAISLFNEG